MIGRLRCPKAPDCPQPPLIGIPMPGLILRMRTQRPQTWSLACPWPQVMMREKFHTEGRLSSRQNRRKNAISQPCRAVAFNLKALCIRMNDPEKPKLSVSDSVFDHDRLPTNYLLQMRVSPVESSGIDLRHHGPLAKCPLG